MWLGLQTVPSLGRCPLFRVTFIERFHCILHTWRSLLTCACSLLPPGPASNRRWEERIHSTFGESNSEASTSAFPKQTASKYSKSGAHWCSHIVHTRPHPHPRTHTMTGIFPFSQSDISDFLESVHLDEYLPILKAEGYSLAEDVENMIGLSKDDLRTMGVTKRGWWPLCTVCTFVCS